MIHLPIFLATVFILWMRPANERRRYIVTSSLIGAKCNVVSHWLGTYTKKHCLGIVTALTIAWVVPAPSDEKWKLKDIEFTVAMPTLSKYTNLLVGFLSIRHKNHTGDSFDTVLRNNHSNKAIICQNVSLTLFGLPQFTWTDVTTRAWPDGHWGRDKWPPFSRRHFQMHFLEWKCINFD